MNVYKLQMWLDKCQFIKTEIIYLGYHVDSSSIRPNLKNISVIKDYPMPTNTKVFST